MNKNLNTEKDIEKKLKLIFSTLPITLLTKFLK